MKPGLLCQDLVITNTFDIFFDYTKSYLSYLLPSFADIFPFILPVKLPERNSSSFTLLGNGMRVSTGYGKFSSYQSELYFPLLWRAWLP